MRLFCSHQYSAIKRTHVPTIPGHTGVVEYDLMCIKCGRHKVVNAYQWLIIKNRQKISRRSTMKPDLKKQLQEVRETAKAQSDKWWELISNDDDYTPWTDEDQSEVDEIIAQYESVIEQLKGEIKHGDI